MIDLNNIISLNLPHQNGFGVYVMRNKADLLWALAAIVSFLVVSTMDAQDRELVEGKSQDLCGWVLVDGGATRDCGESDEQ